MWGLIRAGRVSMTETYRLSDQVNAGTFERTINISGQEFSGHYGPLDNDLAVQRRQEDILGLAGTIVPVTFSDKSDHNGYYEVHDVGAELLYWPNEIRNFEWSMILRKYGADNAVDVESRIGTVVRANDFALTGERWHAPPIGHYGYFTGSTLPASNFTRSTEDGAITVYRSIPADVNPRWGCPVASYRLGRARLLTDGFERNGTNLRATPTGWELSNALLRVRPLTSGGMIEVASWGGTAWETKAWNIARGGATTALGAFDSMNVIRNDMEMVTIRLVKADAPGRALVDLTLRRGSRFVEVYVQTSTSTTLGIFLQTTETASNQTATGYVTASANDASGNRFIVGSARSVAYTTDRGISKAAVTSFDGYIGSVVDGSGAVAGDAAADLRNQYIGSVSEATAVVKR